MRPRERIAAFLYLLIVVVTPIAHDLSHVEPAEESPATHWHGEESPESEAYLHLDCAVCSLAPVSLASDSSERFSAPSVVATLAAVTDPELTRGRQRDLTSAPSRAPPA